MPAAQESLHRPRMYWNRRKRALVKQSTTQAARTPKKSVTVLHRQVPQLVSEDTDSDIMELEKKQITKEDGRYLVFYHFADTATPEQAEVFRSVQPASVEIVSAGEAGALLKGAKDAASESGSNTPPSEVKPSV